MSRVLFFVAQLDAVIRAVFDTLIEGLTADGAELGPTRGRWGCGRRGRELLALGSLTLLFQGMPHQPSAKGPEPRANRRPRPGMVMGLIADNGAGSRLKQAAQYRALVRLGLGGRTQALAQPARARTQSPYTV